MPVMIKICGLTTPEALDAALEAGADMVGFVFFAASTRPGGLGKRFDWTILERFKAGVPFMLSGGLDADNVAEALRITGAPGVDVSSGVERAPGEKDLAKIRAFVGRAREAADMLAAPDRMLSR